MLFLCVFIICLFVVFVFTCACRWILTGRELTGKLIVLNGWMVTDENTNYQWRRNHFQAGVHLTFADVVHDRARPRVPQTELSHWFRPLMFHPLAFSPIKTKRKYKSNNLSIRADGCGTPPLRPQRCGSKLSHCPLLTAPLWLMTFFVWEEIRGLVF